MGTSFFPFPRPFGNWDFCCADIHNTGYDAKLSNLGIVILPLCKVSEENIVQFCVANGIYPAFWIFIYIWQIQQKIKINHFLCTNGVKRSLDSRPSTCSFVSVKHIDGYRHLHWIFFFGFTRKSSTTISLKYFWQEIQIYFSTSHSAWNELLCKSSASSFRHPFLHPVCTPDRGGSIMYCTVTRTLPKGFITIYSYLLC